MRVFTTLNDITAATDLPEGTSGAFRFLPKYKPAGFVCGRCGNTVEFPFGGGGTGYAHLIDTHPGKPVCYACCGEVDKEYMRANGKITLYLVERDGGHAVTNWPGTLRFDAVKIGRKVTITGPDGAKWTGTESARDTQCILMRKEA